MQDGGRQHVRADQQEKGDERCTDRNECRDLPDKRSVAVKRLVLAKTKLKAANIFEAYDEVFKDWGHKGITEKVPEQELKDKRHYLPHRGVFKENSTELRPVFYASCKQKGYPSLNGCSAKGPNLLNLLPANLLKFREREIGVISDTKKASLQISVNKEDRDYLRFL
ncbi:uncharacterized protein LOC118203475 [Stegodyphus dumicola]|uniref:uncharacterized protein LOC118203475 n=1 Tax=Stegodyphus dumicola TaxID=202533 RepID=UPI0015AC4182|nr:uncharacterized protein LOC118203475 [Stegodyphus dumicola]